MRSGESRNWLSELALDLWRGLGYLTQSTNVKNSENSSQDDAVRYRFAEVKGEDWESDEYRIKFPSIRSEFDIEGGDWIHLELHEEEEPWYLRGVKSAKKGTSTEGYLKIYPGDKTVEFKLEKQWEDLFRKPLYQVAMEFYPKDEPHFRIYDAVDFAYKRIPVLREEGRDLDQVGPLAFPAIWKSLETQSGAIDLASLTPYSGQRVRIIPFDANHQIFQEKISGPITHSLKPHRLLRQDGITSDQIPRFQPKELTIEWDPSGRIPDPYPIFKTAATKELEIILPRKGCLSFSTMTQSGSESTRIYYGERVNGENQTRDIVRNMGGSSIEETPEGHTIIYVPCLTRS